MPFIVAFIIGFVIAVIWDLPANGGGLTSAILTPNGRCAVIGIGVAVMAVGSLALGAWASVWGWPPIQLHLGVDSGHDGTDQTEDPM